MIRRGVTSKDLSDYFASGSAESAGLLPHLIKRLVDATTTDIGPLRMPGGEDVALPGWDGRVSHPGNHPYIPAGESAWEMGIDKRPRDKAERDYNKRCRSPGNVDPGSTTFVFVTPHRWDGQEAWVRSHAADGIWKAVRVIDGPTISQWLESAPAVTAWLCGQMGRSIEELDDAEFAWSTRITAKYGSRVSPDLIIGGRTDAAKNLAEWLGKPGAKLTIAGESVAEAVDFVAAVAQTLDPALKSRILFARTASCSHYLIGLKCPHVVVLGDPSIEERLSGAALRSLHLVVPSTGGPGKEAGIALRWLKREAVVKALVATGMEDRIASRMASESGGSLQALLWMITTGNPDLAWLSQVAAPDLVPLVLAGGWVDVEHPDHEVVDRLANRPAAEWQRVAMRWREPHGPLHLDGGTWGWTAWRFAWQRLAGSITPALARRFAEVAVAVLGEADPALELPERERWLAGVRGQKHRYSKELRGGLIRSIAMFGSQQDFLHGIDGAAIAEGIVHRLLENGNDKSAWLSLAPNLLALAEGAPEVFLRAADQMVKDKDTVLELFKESGLFGSARHTGLLWALEALAWSPDYLARAVLLLGRLAELDPGGHLANRPSASLRAIFLPWLPATSATAAQRLAALDHLVHRHPVPGFSCCLGLLPRVHDSTVSSGGPDFRPWGDTRPRVSQAEYQEFVDGVIDRLAELAGNDGERWTRLAASLPRLMKARPEKASEVIRAMENVDTGAWTEEIRLSLSEKLRELAELNLAHTERDWAVSSQDAATLKRLADLFLPHRARHRHRWLFETRPRSHELDKLSFEEEQKRLRTLRCEAVDEVITEESLDAVFTWADEVGDPGTLGAALAWSGLVSDPWDVIRRTVLSEQADWPPTTLRRLGFGFIRTMQRERGPEWQAASLATLHGAGDRGAMLRFVKCLWPTLGLWQELEATYPDLSDRYWSDASIEYLHAKEALWAIPRLLGAGRLLSVLSLISTALHDHKANREEMMTPAMVRLCEQVLRATCSMPCREDPATVNAGSLSHGLEALLQFAEGHAAEIPDAWELMAQCEWQWLPALESTGRGYRALSRALAESAVFFVDLLALVFRSEDEPEGGASAEESDHERWRRAYQVLQAWRIVPGLDLSSAIFVSRGPHRFHEGDPTQPFVKGQVDAVALEAWIAEVRRLAEAKGRLRVADSHIGQVLAYAPADEDGSWPCRPVRACIECACSPELERGLECEIKNRRGVHHLGADGSAERELRNGYQALAARVAGDAPRTSCVLRSVAYWYDAEARRNDADGRFREFRG